MTGHGSGLAAAAAGAGYNPRRRLVLAAAALGLAIWALTVAGPFRQFEAQLAGHELNMWRSATTVGDVVYVGLHTPHELGLRLTSECTSLLLMLPSAAAFSLFVSFRGVSLWRAVCGLAVAVAIEFGANQLRIYLIAVSWWHWGSAGFWVSHAIVGSVLSLVMALAGLYVQARMSGVTNDVTNAARRDY